MDTYQTAMTLELEDIDEERIKALNNITAQKKIVAKGYNKTIKHWSFDEGDLVWNPLVQKIQSIENDLQNGKDRFIIIKSSRVDFII